MLLLGASYCVYSVNADIITIDDKRLFIHEKQMNTVAAFGAAQNITSKQYKKLFFDGVRPILKFITDATNTGYMTPKEQNRIITAFLKVANNPIGKLLLYRILIEIRRISYNCAQSGDCKEEQNYNLLRGKNKSITFVKDEYTIAYNERAGVIYIKFDWFNTNTDFQVVGKLEGNVFHIVTEGTCDEHDTTFAHGDVWLFHEMLHWYHFLHDRATYDAYSASADNKPETITSHKIGQIFYKDYTSSSPDNLKKISAHQWLIDGEAEEEKVSYEEMRTILGGDVNNVCTDGDELSENAYRIYARLPMRFGHCTCEYLEDKNIIEKARDNAVAIQRLMSRPDMKWNTWRLTKKSIADRDDLSNGLGESKVLLNHD